MSLLTYLLKCPAYLLWIIFLLENTTITILTLAIGRVILKSQGTPTHPITKKQWFICIITNIINTIITYWGFRLWANGYININTSFSAMIVPDTLLLFFAMDLLMFIFHYFIHHSFVYKSVHYFHHLSVDPTPIDLFILHPVETFAFGGLWLTVLFCYSFNIYAIVIYLVINVIFGMIGHLGSSKAPSPKIRLLKYLGTARFHHNHHKHTDRNYGFYTSIWDRMLGTYSES
ncbi:sterol desaturase family protein [Mucilaginibacter sp. AW1-3]